MEKEKGYRLKKLLNYRVTRERMLPVCLAALAATLLLVLIVNTIIGAIIGGL